MLLDMNKFQLQIKKFCEERDWNQFFDPKDLLPVSKTKSKHTNTKLGGVDGRVG